MADFDWGMLSDEDRQMAKRYLGEGFPRQPNLTIAPDGKPYLYRWRLLPDKEGPGSYLHVQVASDPERPLHNHPWDNMSVILAGMYMEQWQQSPPRGITLSLPRIKGDVIFRRASEAHRLILPKNVPYTMTHFTFGPEINDWGFWYPDGFRSSKKVTRHSGNVAMHVKGSDAQRQEHVGSPCVYCGYRQGDGPEPPCPRGLQDHVEELLEDSRGG